MISNEKLVSIQMTLGAIFYVGLVIFALYAFSPASDTIELRNNMCIYQEVAKKAPEFQAKADSYKAQLDKRIKQNIKFDLAMSPFALIGLIAGGMGIYLKRKHLI